MKNNTLPTPDLDNEVLEDEELTEKKSIVLYNDDYNSFQHVIKCLVKYCKHNSIQAEQCANIVHYNGKCSVKNGEESELKPIHEALLENGLTSKIE